MTLLEQEDSPWPKAISRRGVQFLRYSLRLLEGALKYVKKGLSNNKEKCVLLICFSTTEHYAWRCGKEGLSPPCHIAALFDMTSRGRPLLITLHQILFNMTNGGRPLLVTLQFSLMWQVGRDPCLLYRNPFQHGKWGRPLLVALQFSLTHQVEETPACCIATLFNMASGKWGRPLLVTSKLVL